MAWLTESEDGWLQPLTEASLVEMLPVYALEVRPAPPVATLAARHTQGVCALLIVF